MKSSIEYKLQTIGCILLIIGYFILLYFNVGLGVFLRFVGNLFLIPYPVKMKYWNLVILESFFICLDFSKLIQIVFFN